jgi:predicted metal-dependent peptidase
MDNDIEDELSRWIIKLLIDEPFYAHFLGQVSRVISKDVTETAAVGLRQNAIYLFINPEFFLTKLKTLEERVAIIKHEVLHLVFKHLYRHKSNWNAHTANIAADIVVNQYVSPWPLPEGAILLEQFSVLNLKPEETIEYYYSKLIEAKQAAPQKISDIKKQLESEGNNDNKKEEIQKKIQDWEKIDDLLNNRQSDGAKIWLDDHGKWSDQAADEAEIHRIDDAILTSRNRMKEKDWHNLQKTPEFLKQVVEAILEKRKPQVDWKRSLRIFANSSRHSKVVGTMKRYSKRFGEPSTGIRIKSFQKIAVIIDTSGSIDDESLSLFFTEIHAMWKKRAEILVIECDAAVGQTYPYRGKFPKGVSGRGGTEFNPAFEYLQKERKRKKFDGCIYLTDGFATVPTIKPPCKLLWVLTPNGTDENLAFGSNVSLS